MTFKQSICSALLTAGLLLSVSACASITPKNDMGDIYFLLGSRSASELHLIKMKPNGSLSSASKIEAPESWYLDTARSSVLFGVGNGTLVAFDRSENGPVLIQPSVEAATPGRGTSVESHPLNDLVLTSHFDVSQLTARPFLKGEFGQEDEFGPAQNFACGRAHQFRFSRDGRFAYAACRDGRLMAFKVDETGKRLEALQGGHRDVSGGPRHLTFHPASDSLYLLLETSSEIAVFDVDPDTGQLSDAPVQSIKTTLDGAANASSDIQITPDGRWLYAFNRKREEMARFAVGADRRLRFLGVTPMGEGRSRRWAMGPNGAYMLVATQEGHVSSWAINPETGDLQRRSRLSGFGEITWAGVLP